MGIFACNVQNNKIWHFYLWYFPLQIDDKKDVQDVYNALVYIHAMIALR